MINGDETSQGGYLELIIGPMFSGKTSKLLDLYKQYKFCNLNVAVINHSEDTRYNATLLSSHDKVMIPCIQTTKLNYLIDNDEIYDSNVILINEGQFFDDLYGFVVDMLKFNKKIHHPIDVFFFTFSCLLENQCSPL
jgi:thymidine kinase